MTLDQLLDSGEEQARRVLINTTDQLLPLFHLERKNGEAAVIGAPWGDAEDRQIGMAMMGYMVKQACARYMFVTEAWMANQDHPWREGDTLPSKRDDKFEVVIITACEPDKETFRILEIKRSPDGVCTDLVRNDEWKAQYFSGANLFK